MKSYILITKYKTSFSRMTLGVFENASRRDVLIAVFEFLTVRFTNRQDSVTKSILITKYKTSRPRIRILDAHVTSPDAIY